MVAVQQELTPILEKCLNKRAPLLDDMHHAAVRLFNGFLEGCPDLVIDLFATTLVFYNYASNPSELEKLCSNLKHSFLERFPWIQTILVKTRNSSRLSEQQGKFLHGISPDIKVRESSTWYAVDLTMNQDASFYLDTRNLRQWLFGHSSGWRVLNTFAYTGSLGIAALAGEAHHVLQTDRSRKFLALSEQSCEMNGYATSQHTTIIGDFFPVSGRLRGSGELFDCVIIDPPFFSSTSKGTVDMLSRSQRIINKVRPLVKNDGYLIAINNALFLSGADYLHSLETLCSDGYMTVESLIPVPEDVTGYPNTIINAAPADPAPFNHSTKIAILKVRKK